MKRSILWWTFLSLFPLAYLAGVILEITEERPARIVGAFDRAMSIKAAQQLAESKGISVAGWTSFVTVETHNDLLSYYAHIQKPGLVAAASTLAPGHEATVLFRAPDQKSEFRAYLSLNGEVTGFDAGKHEAESNTKFIVGVVEVNTTGNKATSRSTVTNTQAEQTARSYLAGNATLNSILKLETPSVHDSSDDPKQLEVSWDASPAAEKELIFQIAVTLRNGKVVAQRTTAKIDSGYAKSALPKTSRFPGLLNGIYGSFLTFSIIYSLIRYTKRTLQKEVSHARTFIVAALFFVSYSTYVYCLAVDQLATRIGAAKFQTFALPAYASAILSFAVMGLLVGIAYSSGEGEVREAYPGKLTPLDALLAGQIFSRNVATSILYGVAAGGWLLLCQHALAFFLPADMAGARSDGLRYTFARLPWLSLLVGRQYESLLIAVTGLLLPAAFLVRSKSRGKLRYFWLLVFALCAVTHDAASYPTVPASLLAMGVSVTALLAPFFAFDLLAAIVSLSALAFVNELARLSAVFPSWINFALWLGALAAATLAVIAYFAIRGRSVAEEDVRPLYAKNLAERMGLQAEVHAARESQLRLMPQAPPHLLGMEVAACCLPAKGVGGDFYDFFPLDANRLGIFVAQGGERGLASALCVALAKGVLMHASQQSHSAAQIVTQLQASMEKLLQGGTGADISFLYAVIDSHRQSLNYARIGASPNVLIHRRNSGFTHSAILESRAATATPILEGAAQLASGDHLFFFTGGVASLRLKRFAHRPNQALDVLINELSRKGESMQTLLASTLAKYQHRSSVDLTAVVLRALGSVALQKEDVA